MDFSKEETRKDTFDESVEYKLEDCLLLTNIKTEIVDICDEPLNYHERYEFSGIKTEHFDESSVSATQELDFKAYSETAHFEQSNLKIKEEFGHSIFDTPPNRSETVNLDELRSYQNSKQICRKLRCKFCKKCFVSKKQLAKHICRKCFEKCLLCGQYFNDKLLFLTHFFMYHFLKTKRKSGRNQKNMFLKKKTKVEQHQYEICSKLFLSNQHLTKQANLVHCKICSKSHTGRIKCRSKIFASKSKLKTRLRIISGSTIFKCKSCSKSFSKKSYLKRHTRIHTAKKECRCEICFKSFLRRDQLRRHLRTHTGEKPFHCKICSKSFAENNTLNQHIMTIHNGEKPFICKVCFKSFTQNSNLKLHLRIHTGDRPFRCKICPKTYKDITSFKRHTTSHTGQKPFSCKVCLKSYTLNSSLTRHMRIHTGEIPFRCEICSKSFTRKYLFTQHKNVHRR